MSDNLRGFAKMKEEDPEKLHEIASKGGHAPKSSGNQGFASMDPDQQKEIASKGGLASQEKQHAEGKPIGFAKLKEEDPERLKEIARDGGKHSHDNDNQ